MTVLGDLAEQRVRALPQYRPGRGVHGATVGKLSSNEAVLGPGPHIIKALRQAALTIDRYPNDEPFSEQLAEHLGVRREQVLVTNGSDEICFLVAEVFLSPTSQAVLGDPGYQIDGTVSLLVGAHLARVPLVDGAHDLPAMARAAANASVIWIPSPHNPTGVLSSYTDLVALLNTIPDTCLVVLDEAYRDYVDPNRQFDSVALLDQYPNLLIQRTMSKSWALAGIRLGYCIGASQIIAALRRVRAPFSVNALALAAGSAAIARPEWQHMSVARTREARADLQFLFDELDIKYYPSQANFVTARLNHDFIAPHLAQAGISVRPGEDLGMPGWTRFTIGWAPTMSAIRDVLREIALHKSHQLLEVHP